MSRWIAKGKLHIEKPSGRRDYIVYSSRPFYSVEADGPDELRCMKEIEKSYLDELEETESNNKLLHVYFLEVVRDLL